MFAVLNEVKLIVGCLQQVGVFKQVLNVSREPVVWLLLAAGSRVTQPLPGRLSPPGGRLV